MFLFRLHELLAVLGDTGEAQLVKRVTDVAEDDRLRVVVFGDFNRGKSTLINALLGRELLQAKLIPTTGHITHVRYGQPEQIIIHFCNGTMQCVELSQLNEISTLDSDGRVREDIESLTVEVDVPLLANGLELIDTPGRNEASRQSERAAAALMSADVVLWLLDARQCLHQREQEMTLAWLRERSGVPLLPIVNFMNLLDNNERRDVRERLDHWGKDCLQDVTEFPQATVGRCYFEVNIRSALLQAISGTARPADDFDMLTVVLSRMSLPGGEVIRNRSRAAQVRAVLARIRDSNAARLQSLRSSVDLAKRKCESQRNECVWELRALDAQSKTKNDVLVSIATGILDRKLNDIKSWFDGETRTRLVEYADDWYELHWRECVAELECLANSTIAELAASIGASSPTGVSLGGMSPPDFHLDVGTLPPIAATGGEVGIGAILGGLFGSIFGPAGTVIGAGIGAGIGAQDNPRPDADYVVVYKQRAEEKWDIWRVAILDELQDQFAVRVKNLTSPYLARLKAIDAEQSPPSLVQELANREEVEKLIVDCLAKLHH